MLLLIVAFLGWVTANVVTNIARLNINTGFSFLARPAGFEIAQKLINYGDNASYFDVFIIALLNTVVLTAVAIVFATILGFVIGLARLSSNQLVAGVAAGYVEIIRNIPLLLQLFYWYFAVLRPLPEPAPEPELFRHRVPQQARALSALPGDRARLRRVARHHRHDAAARPRARLDERAASRAHRLRAAQRAPARAAVAHPARHRGVADRFSADMGRARSSPASISRAA